VPRAASRRAGAECAHAGLGWELLQIELVRYYTEETVITGTEDPHRVLGSKGRFPTSYTVFFKVAFSTFWFKFGATLRRQAERSDSEARHKAPNLT